MAEFPTAPVARRRIYQIYPRLWADADGDGITPGITALPYLRDLGGGGGGSRACPTSSPTN